MATKKSTRRGTKPRTANRKSARSRRKPAVKRISALDKFVRALPFSSATMQRGLTFGMLGIAAVIGIVIANASGVPEWAEKKIAQIAADQGFEVRRIELIGVDRVDADEVNEIVLAESDRAMPQVDLDGLRQKLKRNGWIKEARVTRRLPDTLIVEIQERVPAAVWKDADKYALIDAEGEVLEMISGNRFPKLPLLSGPDANTRAKQLAELLEAAPSLKEQVVGARWVGNRRWNLDFRTGETLELPEGKDLSREALQKFTKLDGVNRLLGRDIINFDMRDPKNLYLRRSQRTDPKTASEESDRTANEEG